LFSIRHKNICSVTGKLCISSRWLRENFWQKCLPTEVFQMQSLSKSNRRNLSNKIFCCVSLYSNYFFNQSVGTVCCLMSVEILLVPYVTALMVIIIIFFLTIHYFIHHGLSIFDLFSRPGAAIHQCSL
jgi:hypothetical protein